MPTDDDHSAIDFQTDDQDSSGLKVDASVTTLALAAVFGSVALPDGMPDYLKAAIMNRADQERDAAGDLIIDNRMHPEGAAARQAKANADDDDDTMSQWAQIVQQERLERERDEWSRTRSTVGDVTMTGAEWSQFAERLRDDTELRRRLMEKFERDGATHDEAEARIDRVAQAADAASVPRSQRTQEQNRILDDRQVTADLNAAHSFGRDYVAPAHSLNSLSGRFEAAAHEAAPESQTPPVPMPRPIVTIAPGSAF